MTPRYLLSLLLMLAGVGALIVAFTERTIDVPPGVIAPEAPRQVVLDDAEVIQHKGYHLTPVAAFGVEARVLGAQRYRSDTEARLAPYDLAVGWGPMSDTATLERLSIQQHTRAYFWQRLDGSMTAEQVIRHSTNMHLIPANATVANRLARAREGHLVRLRGHLVDVIGPGGYRWRTSRSRTDSGMGACEIVWVEALELIDPRDG